MNYSFKNKFNLIAFFPDNNREWKCWSQKCLFFHLIIVVVIRVWLLCYRRRRWNIFTPKTINSICSVCEPSNFPRYFWLFCHQINTILKHALIHLQYSTSRLNGHTFWKAFIGRLSGLADYPSNFGLEKLFGILKHWPLKRKGRLSGGRLSGKYCILMGNMKVTVCSPLTILIRSRGLSQDDDW